MPYDLSEAFEKIEDELIGSMIRNLDRHRAGETKQGFKWEQWQAVQLKALEDYRKTNMEKFPPRYNKLNNQIRTILQDSFNDGSTKQERRILQAIKRVFKGYGTNAPAFTGNVQTQGAFFTVNDRKLNALVESTIHDMNKAEYAVLRRADDQYRQIIYNAQVYANTGAGTYEKAVDMATRDFLRAGINSIEYKNSSRHTISDYADMAIRTAAKRAYLQGEGEMRRGWGISTVILNKRSCPCPLCAPFVGKIFIDDVWSGGTAEEAKEKGYPLLSEAIAQGLYHPRCKDVHTTYFEGITTSEESYSKKELDEQKEKYTAEEKQAYCKRQEKRFSRMSKYSLDTDNRRMYGARAKEWNEKAKSFENSVKTVENAGESGIIKMKEFHSKADPMYEVMGSAFESNPKEVQQIIDILKEWGVKVNYGSSTLGYGCTCRGKPGTMSITKEASYSAWCHEFQHIKDDKEAGWDGLNVLWFDHKERERRERRAYDIEIQLAREAGREDIVKRLEENLDEEVRKIYSELKR